MVERWPVDGRTFSVQAWIWIPTDSPAYAEWLDDVLNALKVERTVLVGMSQGAWVALKYTTEKPDKVEKLVLICPGGVIPIGCRFSSARYAICCLVGGVSNGWCECCMPTNECLRTLKQGPPSGYATFVLGWVLFPSSPMSNCSA